MLQRRFTMVSLLCASVVCLSSGALGSKRVGLSVAPTVTVGTEALSVAAGDFNGDAHLDLAVSNAGVSGPITILLGNGKGGFTTGATYPYSGEILVADINGDGRPDLIVVSVLISVLLGNGDGTFTHTQDISVGSGNASLSAAIGDLNGDGKPELAVASFYDNYVAVLINIGNGFFELQNTYPTGKEPESVAVADFNNDQKMDVAVANTGDDTFSILLGNGNGTFQTQLTTASKDGAGGLIAADWNSDGKMDIAVSGAGVSNSIPFVNIFLGNGDGTFGAPTTLSGMPGASSMLATDLNKDGRTDLLVASKAGLSVFLGRGTGSFASPRSFGEPEFAGPAALGDFNGDGKLDVVLVNGKVSLLFGNGNGTFRAPTLLVTSETMSGGVAGDFDGDGKLDLAVAVDSSGTTNGGVSIFSGNGNGTFKSPTFTDGGSSFGLAFSSQNGVAAGDFNHDGKLDVVVANTFGNGGPSGLSVLMGKGNGTFQPPTLYAANSVPDWVIVADVNNDGRLDLVSTNSSGNGPVVLLGNGDGTFQSGLNFNAGFSTYYAVTADVNGDGKADLACVHGNSVTILLGNGDGTFHSGATSTVGSFPESIVAADLNGDGKIDLATGNYSDGTISVLLGNGDGTFRPAVSYFLGSVNPIALAAVDVNGDGHPDLTVSATCPTSSDCVFGTDAVLLNIGNGTFQKAVFLDVLSGPSFIVADWNGDGSPDLVSVLIYTPGTAVVLLNSDGTVSTLTSTPNPSNSGQSVTFTASVQPSVTGSGAPSGRVTFKDGSSTLGTGQIRAGKATFSTSGLAVGSHSITAVYGGDVNFNGSTSSVLIQIVN